MEMIVRFFQSNPNVLLSPSKVAKELDTNLNTTTTMINRLANEGTIIKEGRGLYMYATNLEPELYKTAYQSLYNIIQKAVGMPVTYQMMGLSDENYDKDAPLESIKKLKSALSETFGEETTNHLVMITLKKELGDKADIILKEIKVEG